MPARPADVWLGFKNGPKANVRVESDLAPIADVGSAPRHVAEVRSHDATVKDRMGLVRASSDCAHVKGSKSPHCFLEKADKSLARIDDGCEARVSKLVLRNTKSL